MGDLSPHFNRSEFACNCGCKQTAVDYALLTVLERLRKRVEAYRPDSYITVTSGNRCVEYNEKVQKEANSDYVPYSSRSKHMYSIAADIQVKGWSPEEIFEILDEWYPDMYGMGLYQSFVHIDVRAGMTRW